jgi:hypothetical protein
VLAVVQCGCGKCAFNREITGGLERKMIEIAPGAICGDDDLCMIREVELKR